MREIKRFSWMKTKIPPSDRDEGIPRCHPDCQNAEAGSITASLLFGGAEGTRTLDPHNAIVVLSQLSYSPEVCSDLSIAITGEPGADYTPAGFHRRCFQASSV